MSPQVKQILARLQPNDIWGWWLYIIVILVLLTLLMQKQGSPLLGTLMLAGSIMSALILKVSTFSAYNFFTSFIFTIVLWVFPLVVAGMTKSPKSRIPALLAAFLGAVFMFAKWATMPK